MDSECIERRDAELEFTRSAYDPSEAWQTINASGDPVVCRLLKLPTSEHVQLDDGVAICLSLTLPRDYPVMAPLQLAANLHDQIGATTCPPELRKVVLNALPSLVSCTQTLATQNIGDETVFLVLSKAEEWIQDVWSELYRKFCDEQDSHRVSQTQVDELRSLTLGRRLIYSHHIISKTKRSDIRRLASEFRLTGYMKYGWPGLLIVEGNEDDCIEFYDTIRPWSWKYLVVRGEQQEPLGSVCRLQLEETIDANRKFDSFLEVDDMSLVAQHCKEVGLENLFQTAMKVYK